MGGLAQAAKAEAFDKAIQKWKEAIIEILIENVKVPEDTVKNMRIVPAGYYRKPHLLGYKFWLSTLWFQCLGAIPTEEGKLALWKINASRMKGEKVVKKDFKKPIEEQPIVVTETNYKKIALGIAAGAVVVGAPGAGIGAAIGTVAGPVGTVVGALIGGICGLIVGAVGGGVARSK